MSSGWRKHIRQRGIIRRRALGALISGITLLSALPAAAQDTGDDWFRQPAISPDGTVIAFTHKGNLFVVPAEGGTARPLTVTSAWEGHPVWSRDGRYLAFASDRHGNLDVFVMPAEGGPARRLTWHDADDIPSDFAPNGDHILFSSERGDTAESRYGNRRAGELYRVRTTGGTPERIITTPADNARYTRSGDAILYRDNPGYEDPARKHDRSTFTRDIWRYDLTENSHMQLTQAPGGDHAPVPGAADGSFTFLSDRDGIFNVWQRAGSETEKLTGHDTHPVRSLSASGNGTLAYSMHGALFTLTPGEAPRRVSISIAADDPSADRLRFEPGSDVSEFAVSPDGKDVAFIARGDVYVTSSEFDTTVRITATPEEERGIAFRKEGGLVYASERDGKWSLFETLKSDDALYYFAATQFTETAIDTGPHSAYQPVPSPDGKKLAFMGDRLTLMVKDLESGDIHTLSKPLETYATSMGGTSVAWSPDSQWIAYDMASNGRLFFTNIAVQPWDGSEPARDISLSGYTDAAPKWHPSGDALVWLTGRFGRRDHGSHGTDMDVMAGFLNEEAWFDFTRSKEEIALAEAAEKKAKDAEKADEEESEDQTQEAAPPEPVEIAFDRLDERQRRLTIHSTPPSDFLLAPDMSKLFYLARFEGGYDLWVQDFREEETKKLLPLGARWAQLRVSDDGKTLYVLADGRLQSLPVEGGDPKPVTISASAMVDLKSERAYLFDHMWHQADGWFYKGEDKHGRDWDAVYTAYKPKVASISHSRDLADLFSEVLGELNASHTGGRYRGPGGSQETASLGALYDLSDTSGPIPLSHVFADGPIAKSDSSVTAGALLVGVDGEMLGAETNLFQLLADKAGTRTRLTLEIGGERRDLVVKPVSTGQESQWAYERWVETRAEAVDRLSEGRLGYVHVPFMADSVYRAVYRDIFGKYFDREGLVVDTRWNGGGDLMEDLVRLLTSQEAQYTRNAPLGTPAQGEPLTRWTKPTIVLMNEGNYSDGHCFPTAYKNVGGGKLVGTAVPGTCTYVWWERTFNGELVFGVPTLGIFDPAGDWLENKETLPDVAVENHPDVIASGGDTQLEAAVEALLEELD